MKLSKKKTIIIISIAYFIFSFVFIGYKVSNEDFLPFLRYRSITNITELFPDISIHHAKDHTYWVTGPYCQRITRVAKSWGGEERVVGIMFVDGYLVFKDENLHIQDSTIARLRGNQVFPLRIGKTKLIVTKSDILDTILVVVKKEKWGLGISPSQSYRMNEETRK